MVKQACNNAFPSVPVVGKWTFLVTMSLGSQWLLWLAFYFTCTLPRHTATGGKEECLTWNPKYYLVLLKAISLERSRSENVTKTVIGKQKQNKSLIVISEDRVLLEVHSFF